MPANPAALQRRRAYVTYYARRYIEAGYRLIHNHHIYQGACTCQEGAACSCAGKHPRIGGWTTAATSDPLVVEQWIASDPYLNLGLATGQGLLALDIDPRHGGHAWLAAQAAILPSTVQQLTGSGGMHLLYTVPRRYHIKTTSKGQLAPGVDTRGDGGQLIGAPSRNRQGRYRWIAGHAPWERRPTPAPSGLLALLETYGILTIPTAARPAPRPLVQLGARPEPEVILQKYLAEACPGCRNETGFRMAQQFRDNGFSLDEALPYMRWFQQAVDQAHDHYTEQEALASLRSAYEHPPRDPWPGQNHRRPR